MPKEFFIRLYIVKGLLVLVGKTSFLQGVLLNYITDMHPGVGWLGVDERYYFSLLIFFRTADPCPDKKFSQLCRETIFWREVKRGCEENWD